MSAITALFQLNPAVPVSIDHALKLLEAYQCYPADRIEHWQSSSIMLGCHAQWITPESVDEKLPYYDCNHQVAITADAILDYRETLFEKLHIPRSLQKTIPDSQLILQAYCKWGEDALLHLQGDFAFIIWDERNEQLFGARDFSGTRTLYYTTDGKQLALSTTIEPLFTLPFVKKSLHEHWLAQFLAIPGMTEAVDSYATPYEGVFQIPPSHYLIVKKGKLQLSRYNLLRTAPHETLQLGSDAAYIEAFQSVFSKAISSKLRSIGTVGAHLSGGLDSGTVASFAANQLREKNQLLHTYSCVPEEDFVDWTPAYYIADETPYIQSTVQHVGNINDHYLSFAGISPYDEVDPMLSIMEMPYKFFENSYWLKGIMEIGQQQGHKIMLTGARGNHSISWGSWRVSMSHYAMLFRSMKWLQLNQELNLYRRYYRTGKAALLPTIACTAFPFLEIAKRKRTHAAALSLVHPELAKRTNVYQQLEQHGLPSLQPQLDAMASYRLAHYQLPFTWNKSGVATTKLSLRYGLWDRDPTNDIQVIRFCLSLPQEQFAQGGMERSFIRRATSDLLPKLVRTNYYARGLQAADTIHRMRRHWTAFVAELQEITQDALLSELLHIPTVKQAIEDIGTTAPKPALIFTDQFRALTRSLIFARFVKHNT